MRWHVPDEQLRRAGQAEDEGAELTCGGGGQGGGAKLAPTLANWARAMRLMETIGRTEEDLAATLEAMAGAARNEVGARRRLRLAEEAREGARAAYERKRSLQRQAYRLARHGDLVVLLDLLERADTLLAELAELAGMERAVADRLASLDSREGPELAEKWRPLAEKARRRAQRADDQARSLRAPAASPAGRDDESSV